MAKKLMDQAGRRRTAMIVRHGQDPTPRSTSSPPRASALPTWPARTRPRRTLQEIVDYLHNPAEIRRDRRLHAQGHSAGRPSGHRQNHAGQGRGRRGQRAVLLHLRLGVRGDVRGHGRVQGPRPVQAGQGEGPLHRLHRRDRRHRQKARRPAAAATTSASRPSTSCSPRWTASRATPASSFWRPPTGPSRWTRR